MSNDVCDIITLAGKFKNDSELREYSNKQYIALEKAAKRILELEEEVGSLKRLISSQDMSASSNIEKIIVTPEEAICDSQIYLLQERGLVKELTLEEIKKLDILIKNKRLAREQSTTIEGKAKPVGPYLPNAQLLKIAAQTSKDDSND